MEDEFFDDEYDPDLASCNYCSGDGWGIVGVDWDSDDYINGPYDGDIEKCPNCHGSGFAKDLVTRPCRSTQPFGEPRRERSK